MRSIGVEALAARLDQRFSLLAGQRASVDPRHRNLHSLVQWSYELLDPVDQEAFTNLSAFAGSFDLDAADAVCGPAGAARGGSARVVIDLVDKSMVQLVDPDEPRYRLLETLREFGQERLQGRRLARTRRGAPPGVVPRRGRTGAVELDSADEGRWAARIDRDLDNLRAAHGSAVRAGDLAVAARLGGHPARVLLPSRSLRDRRLGRGDDADGRASKRSSAAPVVLGVAAYGRWVRGDLETAIALSTSLDRRRRGAWRPVERPRRAGPRQRPVLQRGDAASTALDGAHGRCCRGERLTGRLVARAVHVVGRRYVDRRDRPRGDGGRTSVRRGRALRFPDLARTGRLRPAAWRCGPATARRPSRRCAWPPTSGRRAGTGGSERSR